jgi:hypothetical protein
MVTAALPDALSRLPVTAVVNVTTPAFVMSRVTPSARKMLASGAGMERVATVRSAQRYCIRT